MRLHFIDECRQSGDRGSLYRCAGMAAVAPCGKFHIRLAFFKYSHHGKITVDSTDGLRDDTTALITYQEQFNPPALQLRYDLRCTVPTPLFRTGTCQIDISGWYEALCQQFFHCLEKCHHRAFGIGRASPPYLSFRNISGKRCMGPLTLRRHYVLMAHEQDRLLRAFSLPVK